MNIIESFKSAIFNILSSKMRTFLTILGIIIGISSVIIITSIGKGFENYLEESFKDFDIGAVSISVAFGDDIKDRDKITLKDIESIKELDNIESIVPDYGSSVSVSLKNPEETKGAYLNGTNQDGALLKNVKMKYGRFIDYKDMQGKSKVAVIDNKLSQKIFGREDSLGEKITVEHIFIEGKKIELEIIGVYEIKDDTFSTSIIYAPVQTVMEYLDNTSQLLERISAKFINIDLFSDTKRNIIKVLNVNHNNTEDKYSVFGNFQAKNSTDNTIKIVTVFIGVVAGISLLVGGIGVMNIMLVTVTERTREIGIRKSLGATNNNIKLQFLIEAISVSLLGGVLGIFFGYIGSFLTRVIIALNKGSIVPQVSMEVVIGSVIISTIIGIIFGVYPAGKAAKLDPIEALRYE